MRRIWYLFGHSLQSVQNPVKWLVCHQKAYFWVSFGGQSKLYALHCIHLADKVLPNSIGTRRHQKLEVRPSQTNNLKHVQCHSSSSQFFVWPWLGGRDERLPSLPCRVLNWTWAVGSQFSEHRREVLNTRRAAALWWGGSSCSPGGRWQASEWTPGPPP